MSVVCAHRFYVASFGSCFNQQGVLHAAGLGGPWYGSDDVIDSVRAGTSVLVFCARACRLEGACASWVLGLG